MKILKNLLYLVLLLLVAFLAVGILRPTVHYGHTITVDKPVQEAWGVHQDASKYADWLAGFKSIELLSGEQGAIGSTYKVVVEPGEGQDEFVMTQTLEAIEEFDHVKLHFDSEMMIFKQTTSFSEEDGKTTVSSDSEVQGKTMMMRSMFALMDMLGGAFQAQEEANFEALKTLITENKTDYYPEPITTMEAAASAAETSAE